MEYSRTSILNINNASGDAEKAKEWANSSIYLLNDSFSTIRKIHDLSGGFNLETYPTFQAAKAQYFSIKEVTIGLLDFFEWNKDRSVNGNVKKVVDHVDKIDKEISVLITDINTWFK